MPKDSTQCRPELPALGLEVHIPRVPSSLALLSQPGATEHLQERAEALRIRSPGFKAQLWDLVQITAPCPSHWAAFSLHTRRGIRDLFRVD